MPYKDKEKQLKAQKDHYRRCKKSYIDRNKKRRLARKHWFRKEVMSSLSCEECGESDIACLDFHHKNPKEKEGNIAQMLNEHRSKELILNEIKKCSVMCANCHRKLHFYEHSENLQYRK